MLFWLAMVVALLLLAVLASAVTFYIFYRLSPERRWQARVQQHLADAEYRLRMERSELESVPAGSAREEDCLRRRALDAFLKSLSVAELEAYPGIGPGTVGKLRSAGFTNLAVLQNAHVRVPGLGAKRLADIENAVGTLVKLARSRFEAGACRQAQDLGAQLEKLRAQRSQRESLCHVRQAAAEEVIATLRPRLQIAQNITFFRYLRRELEPAVPHELLQAPLPDLEQAIRVAEERAATANARQRQSVAGDGQSGSNRARIPTTPCPEDRLEPPPTMAIPADASMGAVQAYAALPAVSDEQFPQALHSESSSNRPLGTDPRELLNLARMEAFAQFAFAVARADGRIARREKELIERYLQTRFGDDRGLLNRARASCAYYESAAIDLTRCLDQITTLFSAEERRELFDFAGEITDATGPRNRREAEFLEKVARKLGISSALQQAGKPPQAATRNSESQDCRTENCVALANSQRTQANPSPGPTADAKPVHLATRNEMLVLLEIDPAAPVSADLVRRQFHLLSERYAPDKFESMGPEFLSVVEKKRAALLAAATDLLEQWGEKLETTIPSDQPRELRHNPDLDAMFGA